MTTKKELEPKALGAELSTIDVRDYKFIPSASNYPERFELDTVPVKNQG